jgi:DNA-binding transcriptional LysR family regulator
MVLAGLGFTYIPEFAVTVPDLQVRPLIEPEVYRTINLVTVRGRPHSSAVGAFVQAAKSYRWNNGSLRHQGDEGSASSRVHASA